MKKVKVYVAVFVYRGTVTDIEVCKNRITAAQFADEWRTKANPDHDVVTVQERVIIE